MGINPADSFSKESVRLDEMKHLVMLGVEGDGKLPEQKQNLFPILQISTSNLSDHKLVAKDLSILKVLGQHGVVFSKVIYPNGGIDQNHDRPGRDRRRGTARRVLSVPPKADRRMRACFSINARSPS